MDVAFRQLKLGPMQNFSYLFGRGESCVIVDCGFEPDRLVAEAESFGMTIEAILVTHGHPDHVQAIPALARKTGARVAAHPRSPAKPDVVLADGVELTLGGVRIRPVFTPGHEPTSVCFVIEDRWLVTGDTLFIGECGRADLPGSDPALLWDSLLNRLATLPGRLIVCPGHDYGATPLDSLANQVATNYTLRPRSRDEFVRFMAEP